MSESTRSLLIAGVAALTIAAAILSSAPASARSIAFGSGSVVGQTRTAGGYVPLGPNTASYRNFCAHKYSRCIYVPAGWPNNRVAPSDRRLKRDVVLLGRLNDGIGIYRFKYMWSDQTYVGVIAQEVSRIVPDAVVRASDGYLQVNYARLGLRMYTWDEWRTLTGSSL